jgi:hypothetical protein
LLQYDPKKDGLEQTRIVLVGNVAAFKTTMSLLAKEANLTDMEPAKPPLDLALFDCAQCHHDLKRKSWRQERGYKATPGRPEFRPFSTALLKIALQHAGGAKEETEALGKKIDTLYKAFGSQPFGNPKQVAEAAKSLENWADSFGQKLNHLPGAYDKSAAISLLKAIAQVAHEETPDYDTARQLAWSFTIIYGELIKTDEGSAKGILKPQQEQIEKLLVELEKGLSLKLPFTDMAKVDKDYPLTDLALRKTLLAEYTVQRQTVYDKYWPENLAKQSDYGPEEAKKAFAAIAELLPK